MNTWKKILADSGKRITRPRQAIIDALRCCDKPQSPEQVLETARQSYPNLGLATVYRTLNLFAEIGVVRLIQYDGTIRYAPATLGHLHPLICIECGKTVEFHGDDDIVDVINQVEKDTGFIVSEHLLQLGGICPECQSKQAENGKSHGC